MQPAVRNAVIALVALTLGLALIIVPAWLNRPQASTDPATPTPVAVSPTPEPTPEPTVDDTEPTPDDTPEPTPPGAISGLTMTSNTNATFTLSWAPPADAAAVATYLVLVNGTSLTRVTTPGITLAWPSQPGTVLVQVAVADASGNQSEWRALYIVPPPRPSPTPSPTATTVGPTPTSASPSNPLSVSPSPTPTPTVTATTAPSTSVPTPPTDTPTEYLSPGFRR